MGTINRKDIATDIAKKIRANKDELTEYWDSSSPVRHFFLDDLLPEGDITALAGHYPDSKDLMLRSTIRENKKVGIDLSSYDRSIEEYLYAFQDEEVIKAVGEVTGVENLEPDPSFYASGISVMDKGDFLNPHLDNSHDGDQKVYRVLNILFYVGPNRDLESGGNLEIWDAEVKEKKTLVSKFNRLAVMETHQDSWHSVSKVLSDHPRLCISNYYFSKKSPIEKEYSHVTSFAGYPEEKFKRVVLRLDSIARNFLGKAFPFLLRRSKHRTTTGNKDN